MVIQVGGDTNTADTADALPESVFDAALRLSLPAAEAEVRAHFNALLSGWYQFDELCRLMFSKVKIDTTAFQEKAIEYGKWWRLNLGPRDKGKRNGDSGQWVYHRNGTPKLHVLEAHAKQYFDACGGIPGLHNEQGLEAIHAVCSSHHAPHSHRPRRRKPAPLSGQNQPHGCGQVH